MAEQNSTGLIRYISGRAAAEQKSTGQFRFSRDRAAAEQNSTGLDRGGLLNSTDF